jgi:hypothetical protein
VIDTLAGSTTHFWGMFDFRSFYAAGSLVADGRGHDLYTLRVLRSDGHPTAEPYFNPPFFALLCAPFSFFSPLHAFQLWTGASVALLCVNCAMISRIADGINGRWRVLMIAGFVTSFPVQHGLLLGQFSQLLCLSWSGAYLALCAGRPARAGAFLSILLIKPELVIPVTLFLAWKRQWRTVGTLVSIAAILAAVSLAIVGPQTAIEYPQYVLRETEFQITWLMLGWNGIISGAFAGANHLTVTIGGVAMGLLTLACVACIWRGTLRLGERRFASLWLALTIATLLTDLHLYVQDTVMLMPALVAYAARARAGDRTGIAMFMAGVWGILWFPGYPDHVLSLSVVFGVGLVAALLALTLSAAGHADTKAVSQRPEAFEARAA